uniref:Uncharacterized protein n=1 Tax=Sphaerodactylus townsendi TaxID=933632 RepID=A0ACB8EFN9_9SAUR
MKMEEADAPRSVLGESLERGGRDLHVLKVGTMREFLSGPGLQLVKQEPEEGLQQVWEEQWQALLESVASPRPQSGNPGLLESSARSETKGFQLSSEGATAANQRLSRHRESHSLLDLSGDISPISGRLEVSSGKTKEETALVPPEEREELENLVKAEHLPLSTLKAEPVGQDGDEEAILKGTNFTGLDY